MDSGLSKLMGDASRLTTSIRNDPSIQAIMAETSQGSPVIDNTVKETQAAIQKIREKNALKTQTNTTTSLNGTDLPMNTSFNNGTIPGLASNSLLSSEALQGAWPLVMTCMWAMMLIPMILSSQNGLKTFNPGTFLPHQNAVDPYYQSVRSWADPFATVEDITNGRASRPLPESFNRLDSLLA